MRKIFGTSKGFTLVELLFATLILGFTLVGLLQVFFRCNVLAQMAQDKSAAMSLVQGKMEEIRNYTYSSIAADYASGGAVGDTFSLTPLTGMGVVYIDEFTAGDANLLQIKIVGSYEDRFERIIGEDLDLDGDLDGGEDVDGDGDLSSITSLISFIASR